MKKAIRIVAPLLAAVMLAALTGCGERGKVAPTAKPTAKASALPSAEASESPAGSQMSSQEPSALPSAEASETPAWDPSAGPSSAPSENADALFPTDAIEGFMEGEVVDPEAVPDLTRLLEARFPGMRIQSVTYKLFEERQAYYVVLQGEGEASHPVYVFADGTVTDEGM